MVNTRSHFAAMTLIAVSLGGCKPSPAAPSPPTPATVVLTITDRVSGQPVVGATINSTNPILNATTGGDGRARVESVATGTKLEISAPGYLKRQVPYDGNSTLSLAPIPELGKEFVYVAAFNVIRGDNRMVRINADLWLNLDSRIVNDPEAVRVFREAAAEISEANGRFTIRLTVDNMPPVGALVADVQLGNEFAAITSVAVVPSAGSDGVITKYGSFGVLGLKSARSKPAVLVGLGGAIGLHQPSSSDPSFTSFLWGLGYITEGDRQLLRTHVWTDPGTYWEDTSPKWFQ